MTRDERRIRTALMAHAADRRRLELAIPANILWHCCCSVGESKVSTPSDRVWWGKVRPLLQVACLEPLAGLPELRWHTAKELTLLLTNTVTRDLAGRPIMTVTMAALRWIEGLLKHDVLAVIEGTAIDQALDLILALVQEYDDLAGDVDKSARKAAVRLHAHLRSYGLYPDVDIFA